MKEGIYLTFTQPKTTDCWVAQILIILTPMCVCVRMCIYKCVRVCV